MVLLYGHAEPILQLVGVRYSGVMWCPVCAQEEQARQEHLHLPVGWCCLMLDDDLLDEGGLKLMVHSCSGVSVHRLTALIRDIFGFEDVRCATEGGCEYMYLKLDPRDRREWRRVFDAHPRSCIGTG